MSGLLTIDFGRIRLVDKSGDPITPGRWVELVGNDNYRHVRSDVVGRYLVATTWNGVDFDPTRPRALVFETAVRAERNGKYGLGLRMNRYASEREAIVGHLETVGWVADLAV